MESVTKKRILTGDRPTGLLHLGHYVGSLKNRVLLQDQYDCYFIIADLHMLTTKPTKEDIMQVRENSRQMVLDYLACGVDPKKSLIYLQSALPAVYELNLFFEMLVSLNRLTGLPSLKEMARNAHMDPESVPFGLVGYPVLQTADILGPKAHVVPVGKDNEAHIELARDIARRFNSHYGEVFPMPEAQLSETPNLIGTDGKGKMSKSAGNAIFLSDSPEIIKKKVNGMFTDPNRIHADDPGTVEGNPVFIYHDVFNANKDEVIDLKNRYVEGKVGDVEVKRCLTEALHQYLKPIQDRRKELEKEKGLVEQIIYEGTLKMIEITNQTLKEVKSAMGIGGTWNKISRVARDRQHSASSI
ncbi:Tryptophan--tRNA ligase 2 [Candidatus Rubidus massiliensis]|nr:MAG: tryptophan--tRNA ligase [Chlamydia sp. 32-24]CDZ79721.1 Tryptophan--tRNA ligase 2 [Candidatus Rubidus massiliensis]